MPVFSYKAKNFKGEEKNGSMEAADISELSASLKSEGYILLDVSGGESSKSEGGVGAIFSNLSESSRFSEVTISSFLKKVSLEEKMVFSRNLAVMVAAGLPISRALEALSREARNSYFRSTIDDIARNVRQGKNLKDSFSSHPKVFSSLYVAMVEAGETSGKLSESLNVLAKQMKTDHELIKRVRSAMIYPAIVVSVMILIGIAMMIYVVPVLVGTFEELGVELPPTTRVIIALSNFFLNNTLLLLIGLPFFVVGITKVLHTGRGKNIMDRIIAKFPIIGEIDRNFNTARTARTLSSLLLSGVSITDALDITSRVLQNHYYKDILQEARASIQKGSTISIVFQNHPDYYSPLLAEMIAVGEETGNITSMLEEVATFYEGEVEVATKDLSTIIEPLLMVVIGGAVGFFAISMIQPLYGVMGGL